uniref:Uncharacterized protein n=1 Tax=Melopsittacus undulatus TaxID=13146 RepID=A0A8C6ISA9_MELUD
MRSSIDWPFSRRFSISMSSFTPSTTICTSSTSEKPRRSALEISNTPPTAAVSTPPGTRDRVSTLTTARIEVERSIQPRNCNPASPIHIQAISPPTQCTSMLDF